MKLTLHAFVTIDGVMQGPGGREEDTDNQFTHGGWVIPFADEDMGEVVDAWFERAGAFLLGRRTYEIFYPYWSKVTSPEDDVAQKLNQLPKHVVSRSLSSLDWENSTLIAGDVVEAVKELKERPGGELQLHGSSQLAQTLVEHDLIDEYRLIVFPVVLGAGKRLFRDGLVPISFETLETWTTSSGAISLKLRPSGSPQQPGFTFKVEEGVGTHEELVRDSTPRA
jgi:dihydrofolate reductase